jgi:hypothetical protein
MMNVQDPRTTEDRTRSASLRRGATLAFTAILALECGVNDAENEGAAMVR